MKVPTKRRLYCRAPGEIAPTLRDADADRDELLCSMQEGLGDAVSRLLPAACFLGECQHRKTALHRQLEAPSLNTKEDKIAERPLSLFLGYSTVLHKPTACVQIEEAVTELHRACASPDPRTSVRDICRQQPQLVSMQNGCGQTPLHVLLLYQSRSPSWPALEEVTSALLECGAPLDLPDQEGDTPLLYLRYFLKYGYHQVAVRLAQLLLTSRAAARCDVNACNRRGSTLLMYSVYHMDDTAQLSRTLLNYGAAVRVRRSSAFRAFLGGVVRHGRLDNCEVTLSLLGRQLARQPAQMQSHVLAAMVSQGQHFRYLGPVFLELKNRLKRYWSQPADLRHLCVESVRRSLQAGAGIEAGASRLALPPAIQHCITLQDPV